MRTLGLRWLLAAVALCASIAFVASRTRSEYRFVEGNSDLRWLYRGLSPAEKVFYHINAPALLVAGLVQQWADNYVMGLVLEGALLTPPAKAIIPICTVVLWFFMGKWLDRLIGCLPPASAGNWLTGLLGGIGLLICSTMIVQSIRIGRGGINGVTGTAWCAIAICAQYLHIRRIWRYERRTA